jgi:hypothetical protein
MAPDLNAVAGGERFDYSTPGSSGYDIDKDVTYNDPNNRKLRVITIGGGVTGIMLAYQIQKMCGNVEHVIYEKNEDIGGTWVSEQQADLCDARDIADPCAQRCTARKSVPWLCLRHPLPRLYLPIRAERRLATILQL